jgi:hypothetical protein
VPKAASRPLSRRSCRTLGARSESGALHETCSRYWRRLSLDPRKLTVKARPARRTCRPHRERRPRDAGIVERPNSHEYQVRPGLCLAEERRTARRAKPSSHPVSTIGDTEVVSSFSSDGKARLTKARVHSCTTCTKVLAVTAPAHPGHYGQLQARPANRAAKASTRYRHGVSCSSGRPFSPVATKLSFRSVLNAADA